MKKKKTSIEEGQQEQWGKEEALLVYFVPIIIKTDKNNQKEIVNMGF